MPKFPEPPATLATLPAITKTLSAGALLWRVYFRAGPHPTTWSAFRAFGPSGGRFDHHLPPPSVQTRAVLYAAASGPTSLAEVFQDTRIIDRNRRGPWLVGFELTRSVDLLDLTGNWPTTAGASMAINTGPRGRARRWSRAVYAAYPSIQGLYYCSSMDANQPAIALYERATSALPASPVFHRALADPLIAPTISRAALRFNYGVV